MNTFVGTVGVFFFALFFVSLSKKYPNLKTYGLLALFFSLIGIGSFVAAYITMIRDCQMVCVNLEVLLLLLRGFVMCAIAVYTIFDFLNLMVSVKVQ